MTTPPTDFRTDRLDRPGVARLRRAVRRLTGHDLVPPPDAVEAFLADMWAGDPLGEAYVDEVQDGPVGRRTARQMLDLALAEGIAAVEDPPATMAALFAEFLGFLRRNLNGQTTLPTHPNWASQSEVVAGFSRFAAPDMLIREDRLGEDLDFLARAAGIGNASSPAPEPWPDFLDDPALKKAAHAAYLRDYAAFGFSEPG